MDVTGLFYSNWGRERPVVYLAAWCLNSSAWDYQTNCLADKALRCIAYYDRRGHGRSSRPGSGCEFDTLADDLATVIAELDFARDHAGRAFNGRRRSGPIHHPAPVGSRAA